MPELRKDPTSSRWVIISTERAKRPGDFSLPPVQKKGGFCPFCTGNEKSTPPEVYSLRSSGEPDAPGWTVRVVPNKFPAMATGGTPARHADGVFEMIDGIGIHEVIVETTSHDATLSDLDDKGFSDVMKTYRQRLMNCAKNHDVKYALIFRNSGLLAGASLEHPHSQLIALPAVPHMIADELETSLVHFKKKGTCLFCDMLEAERRGAARVIAESSGFIAISPYAPRFPFETWVFPRRHMSAFETLDDDAVDSFSKFFKGVLSKMGAVLSNAPYNFMLHTAPTGSGPLNHYHWHVEITPCLTTIAGFERGTNCFINPTSPEEAAKALRL